MENKSQSTTSVSNNPNASREMGRKSAGPSLDHTTSTPLLKKFKLTTNLNPTGIEELQSTLRNETLLDTPSEFKPHTISGFFGQSVAPSPIDIGEKSMDRKEEIRSKSVSTDLSFPLTLPPKIEQFLFSYSNSNANRGFATDQPSTPPIDKLNTSQTRKKLNLTFELDLNEEETNYDSDSAEIQCVNRSSRSLFTDEESDEDYYSIASMLLNFEKCNGRMIPSPKRSDRTGHALGDTLGNGEVKKGRLSTNSDYASLRRSLENNCSIGDMETAFKNTDTPDGGSRFIRGSCDEDWLSRSGEETELSARLKMMHKSPGTSPIRK